MDRQRLQTRESTRTIVSDRKSVASDRRRQMQQLQEVPINSFSNIDTIIMGESKMKSVNGCYGFSDQFRKQCRSDVRVFQDRMRCTGVQCCIRS